MDGTRPLPGGSSQPPETDLEYYSLPENYKGSSLDNLNSFLLAKSRQEPPPPVIHRKTKKPDQTRELFKRYRHILPRDLCGTSSSSLSSSSLSSEEEEDSSDNDSVENVHNYQTQGSYHSRYGDKQDIESWQTARLLQLGGEDQTSTGSRATMMPANEGRQESGYESRMVSDFTLVDSRPELPTASSDHSPWKIYGMSLDVRDSLRPVTRSGRSSTRWSPASSRFNSAKSKLSNVSREAWREMLAQLTIEEETDPKWECLQSSHVNSSLLHPVYKFRELMTMNFVHFPKLNDYALEPQLVRESSGYGQTPAQTNHPTSTAQTNHPTSTLSPSASHPTSTLSPSATGKDDGRKRQRSLQHKHGGGEYLPVDPGSTTTQVFSADSGDCPAPHFVERGQGRNDTNDRKYNISINDKNVFCHNSIVQFFRRYENISLPAEGLDLSDAVEDKSRSSGKMKIKEESTSIPDQVVSTSPGSQCPDSREVDATSTPATPTDLVDRLPTNQPWPDKGHYLQPVAKGTQSSDPLMQISTVTAANLALKNAVVKANTDDKESYLQKFKRITLAVVNVLKLAKVIIKRTDSPSALLKTFTELSREPEKEEESENMKNYGLQFDLSYFRANKEITISSEVKNILRLPPSHRTPEQIQTAMFGLQSLPSFAEYPLHMQEKLTKVAWHEIVTPQRTIIRQGHFAENFYFILSGQAVVTIHKPGETSAQTAAIMRKGTSFGELALLHHSRRTATVTSHDTVQLLSVGREDFFDIFMSGQRKGEVPEHIQFISQLDFMKGWPLERLLERPDQCLLHFFKRNTVIVRDSKLSDWFYVVKSGSCQVLKQLKQVNASLGQPRKQSLAGHGSRGRLGAWPPDLRQTTGRRGHRKTPAGELTKNPATDNKTPVARVTDKQLTPVPVFVQIELLKPKDVFGLDLINSRLDSNPPSVSLVSLGAECVMLSKAFFIKHASDSLRKRFAEIIQPYPDEESLQDSLQTKVNWDLYKRSLILQVASHKQAAVPRQSLMTARS